MEDPSSLVLRLFSKGQFQLILYLTTLLPMVSKLFQIQGAFHNPQVALVHSILPKDY